MSATVRQKRSFAEIIPPNTREFPIRVDAEVVMNTIAGLDDLTRKAADLRRAMVAGVARYERKTR